MKMKRRNALAVSIALSAVLGYFIVALAGEAGWFAAGTTDASAEQPVAEATQAPSPTQAPEEVTPVVVTEYVYVAAPRRAATQAAEAPAPASPTAAPPAAPTSAPEAAPSDNASAGSTKPADTSSGNSGPQVSSHGDDDQNEHEDEHEHQDHESEQDDD